MKSLAPFATLSTLAAPSAAQDAGKITERDGNNNPPRIVLQTNDWDQPELQLSTGASSLVR